MRAFRLACALLVTAFGWMLTNFALWSCCRLKAERSAARIDRAAQHEMQRVEAIKQMRKKAEDRRTERSERELGLKFCFAEAIRHNISILKVGQDART